MRKPMGNQSPQKRITLTRDTLHNWPNYQKLFDEGKVLFDKNGRLRYPHGAPVGEMILKRVRKNGKAIYAESAEEWFDPESPASEEFEWPE
jgi:hypothetical protein